MSEDIALFDAAFFNLAADVASVSSGVREKIHISKYVLTKLIDLPRGLILKLDCCSSLSMKRLKMVSSYVPSVETTN
jgi:hypothetical protein